MAKNAPSCTSAPQLTGDSVVGAQLSVSKGQWKNSSTAVYSYAWYRNGAVIYGAVQNKYTTTDLDIGQEISAQVTATNNRGSGTALAKPTIVVQAVPVDPTEPPPSGGSGDPKTSLTVAWKVNGYGKATTVYVEVSEDWENFDSGFTSSGANIPASSTSQTGNTTVTGLKPNTPYYYRVRAVSSAGQSIIADYGWMRTDTDTGGRELHVGSGQPFNSISAADAVAAPGDKIIVHDGSYNLETLRTTHAGWVWVQAAKGALPKVAGLLFSGGQRVAFIGLAFDGHGMGTTPRIIQTANCAHLRFFDCQSSGDDKMQSYDGGNCWAGPNSSDVHFWNMQTYGSAFGAKAYSGTAAPPTGYRFYGSDMSGATYDIAHMDQYQDWAFERCLHRTPKTVTSEHHDAIQTTGGKYLSVKRCHFLWDGTVTSDGNDNGFICSDAGIQNPTFWCNLIEKWRGAGTNFGDTINGSVYNNSVVGCPGAGGGTSNQDWSGWGTNYSGTTMANNLARKCWIGSGKPNMKYNHWTSGSSNISESGRSQGDPGFSPGTFQPSSTSPCAHSGVREGPLWDFDGRGWGSKGQAKGCFAAADSDAPLVESMALV
jgi:hypothetical protein